MGSPIRPCMALRQPMTFPPLLGPPEQKQVFANERCRWLLSKSRRCNYPHLEPSDERLKPHCLMGDTESQ